MERAIRLVQLTGHEHKLPGQLSGGQQQRVAIARAIVIEPPLILMDEPLSNLDAKLRLEMRSEIRRIHRELGRATIYVTHDQDEALSLADRIVVMKDGVVQQIARRRKCTDSRRICTSRGSWAIATCCTSTSPARRGDRVTVEAPDIRLTGVRKLPLAGKRAAVAIRPEEMTSSGYPRRRTSSPGEWTMSNTVDAIRSSTSLRVAAHGCMYVRRSTLRRAPRCTCTSRPSACSCIPVRAMSAAARRMAEGGGGGRGTRPRAPFDRVLLLVVPAALFMVLLFIYPFVYGLLLSFEPAQGGALENYRKFFTTDNLWPTIGTTLKLALPATIVNVGIALPIAYRMRTKSRWQRFITTLLVVPITLGTVLIAEGMLTYFGPKGWLSQFLQLTHLYDGAIRLTHNYWGVLISLIISGFPFAFLLILSYITGIDPVLARAAATLGADPKAQFRHIYLPLLAPGLAMCFCLAFVQAFSVFPSAVLLGAPAGPTRVISIAAYEAAFEQYDYSMASAIAMIMGFVQLLIVAFVLSLRNWFYKGPVTGGKG